MPSVLQLESLPVLNALTDIFQDNSPRLQDIALYFFPSELTERSAFTSYFDDPFFVPAREVTVVYATYTTCSELNVGPERTWIAY